VRSSWGLLMITLSFGAAGDCTNGRDFDGGVKLLGKIVKLVLMRTVGMADKE